MGWLFKLVILLDSQSGPKFLLGCMYICIQPYLPFRSGKPSLIIPGLESGTYTKGAMSFTRTRGSEKITIAVTKYNCQKTL